jgi:hypothetical protein
MKTYINKNYTENSVYKKSAVHGVHLSTGVKESKIQSDCFTYHWNHYPAQRGQLFMVYNTPKNAAHGSILKAMGMVAGVSDMIYLPKPKHIVFL